MTGDAKIFKHDVAGTSMRSMLRARIVPSVWENVHARSFLYYRDRNRIDVRGTLSERETTRLSNRHIFTRASVLGEK